MTPLSLETWLVIGAIGLTTMFCCAHVLATLLREHERLTALQASCDKLRGEYDRRMKEIMERLPSREKTSDLHDAVYAHDAANAEPLEVEVLDDEAHAA